LKKRTFQMILIAISGALLGAVFGLRFRVLVLLPAILLGVLSVAVISATSGTPVSTMVINATAWTVAIQFGYLGGLFTRFIMVAARLRTLPHSHALARAPH
jgi:hypothetical protein